MPGSAASSIRCSVTDTMRPILFRATTSSCVSMVMQVRASARWSCRQLRDDLDLEVEAIQPRDTDACQRGMRRRPPVLADDDRPDRREGPLRIDEEDGHVD